MRILFVFVFFYVTLLASVKTPSDVYSESMVLKKLVVELRKENGITAPLPRVAPQTGKKPRHVLQKTLEILTKVNKYREIHGYGQITVPPVPPRDITPQDVYNNVERLKVEVAYLLKNKSSLNKKEFQRKNYTNKTPSDVYRELWTISLGFDKLLGQGFTPTDVYILSEQIVEKIKFLRSTQRENRDVKMPPKQLSLHPNHALYKSVDLIKKINKLEKKLWIEPVPVPKVKQKVISPTEVYDSLQTAAAELNRISRRLGVERSFALKKIKEKKTPSDVVQNLEYAIALLPDFSFQRPLNQYPKKSLIKTPNDVFALSEFILKKIAYIKNKKGIKVKTKKTTYIYGLKPIHVYVKGLEDLEKVAKIRELEGFKPSQTPSAPNTEITPSEVYELILRLDDEINLLYPEYHLTAYRDYLDKKEYNDKTPSDVYDNLWKLSYELDAILNQEYTPNETFVLAKKIENDLQEIAKFFTGKKMSVAVHHYKNRRPSDVFGMSQQLMDTLHAIKRRGNISSAKIALPQDQSITPTTVYNALRIISGTISEIRIYYGIEEKEIELKKVDNKTPSDVYTVTEKATNIAKKILEDRSYEN